MHPRFRDAASVHVDVPADRVEQLLTEPQLLRALDDRLAGSNLEIQRTEGSVKVRDPEGHVRFAFRLAADAEGTRVSVLEDVQPDGPLEATKHMFFPGQTHQALERELDRLRVLLEAIDEGRQNA